MLLKVLGKKQSPNQKTLLTHQIGTGHSQVFDKSTNI